MPSRGRSSAERPLTAVQAGEAVVPASSWRRRAPRSPSCSAIRGKKALENEILKEAVEDAPKKADRALALVPRGRRQALGLA